MNKKLPQLEERDFLFYRSKDTGKAIVKVALYKNNIWATQKGMGLIFKTERSNITKHLKNIFSDGELREDSVCEDIAHTALDGKKYKTRIYSLDAIISVGYRVTSYEATRFRVWATGILKEYMLKGFVVDDERLKQGNDLFGEDYFAELLERIREIRALKGGFIKRLLIYIRTQVLITIKIRQQQESSIR